jgi:hypothetical protein
VSSRSNAEVKVMLMERRERKRKGRENSRNDRSKGCDLIMAVPLLIQRGEYSVWYSKSREGPSIRK